ncbi:beta-1,6-N-acetylglucosaminyltransferase [Bacillus sp. JJ1503]|uniref:beta-1,6-N-acetylglucosaminyltransferase n=1 Tax=Bacillus sp. JJ1503 TaxID=3122956 RepID=UPI003000CF11
MELNRHAYLIVAHNNFDLLQKLIQLLDDTRNDIYLHVDKKVSNFDSRMLKVKHSNLRIYQEIKVNWGGASQVKCELFLLSEAIKEYHQYYHLISGVDLPLKTQDEIHAFFNENQGKEFVHFDSCKVTQSEINRVKYYHFLQEFCTNIKNNTLNKIVKAIKHLSIFVQKILCINRYKGNFQIQKGSNWFSITNDLAVYVVSKKSWIQNFIRFTVSSDEIFLQTLVANSSFKNKLYNNKFDNDYRACMRYIDWKRGNPYIFQSNDFDELINSSYLFARKFNPNIDAEIINKIYEHLEVSKQNGQ